MKVSCNVIRDLLPLYAEKLTSPDSNRLVEAHLTDCPECSRQLSVMQKAAPMPVEVDTDPLKKIRQVMRKRWALTALTAVLLVVTIVCQGMLLLDARVYLTPEQAVESVEVMETGEIAVHWTDYVVGSGNAYQEDAPEERGLVAMSTVGKLLFGERERDPIPYEQQPQEFRSSISEKDYHYFGAHRVPKEVTQLWYCDAGTGMAQQLLWGEKAELPQEPLFDHVNYNLAWYCGGMVALAFLFGCGAYCLRGKKTGVVSVYLTFLFASIGISTAIVSGFQFVEIYGEFTEHFQEGIAVAPLMFFTLVCGYQLYRLSRH